VKRKLIKSNLEIEYKLQALLPEKREPVRKLQSEANGRMNIDDCIEYKDPLYEAKKSGVLEIVIEECIADFLKRKSPLNNKKIIITPER